jgi:hypothetical protein
MQLKNYAESELKSKFGKTEPKIMLRGVLVKIDFT